MYMPCVDLNHLTGAAWRFQKPFDIHLNWISKIHLGQEVPFSEDYIKNAILQQPLINRSYCKTNAFNQLRSMHHIYN